MVDIVWMNPNTGGLVVVDLGLIEMLMSYRQIEQTAPEAGGFLVGTYRPPHFLIEDVTLPGAKDVRTRSSFVLKDASHFVDVKKQWSQSGGVVSVVGQWHTHPEAVPKPSRVDRLTADQFECAQGQSRIQLIVGINDLWCGHMNSHGVVAFLRDDGKVRYYVTNAPRFK